MNKYFWRIVHAFGCSFAGLLLIKLGADLWDDGNVTLSGKVATAAQVLFRTFIVGAAFLSSARALWRTE